MKLEHAPDVKEIVSDVVDRLELAHIDPDRIVCMRSWGAKAQATARIWAFPKIWQKALNLEPSYVIEVLSHHFDSLPKEEKERVVIHELMHVPKGFGGGLVPHNCFGKRIDRRSVEKLFNNFKKSPGSALESPDGVIEMR